MSTGAAARTTAELLLHLPRPLVHGSVSLEETIARRRSVREFAHEPLTSTQLSQLLWAVTVLSVAGLLARSIENVFEERSASSVFAGLNELF